MKPRPNYHYWKKEEYEYIIKMYPTTTIAELADHFGCQHSQIVSIILDLRKNGFNLPSKERRNTKVKAFAELKAEHPEYLVK
jgi:hypothetical protein